ncbi:MAG: alpha-galactosidase [Acholeplasmataceae bacterium]|nr:alpha-galactosidase [Acholeplasmataceae bacterium]
MIYDLKPYFKLETKDLHYIFRILPTGQLEHLYFGRKIIDDQFEVLHAKITAGAGSQIEYERDGHKTLLDMTPLEYSGIGKGDFRLSPIEIKMPDGTYVSDFIYDHHQVIDGTLPSESLPLSKEDDKTKTLIITMKDEHLHVEMDLVYSVFFESNTISRRVILRNKNQNALVIRKIMSMMLDLDSKDYDLYTFDGGWIKEAHKHKRALSYGTYSVDSTTGSSSNRHNPGIILAKKDTNEDRGICIGLNLIYSGNHYEAVQISNHDLLRVMTGINPHCFEWELKENEIFETPEAVLSYSDQGFNQLSKHFHDFINHHIVPRQFQYQTRPVVLNSWEAFYFNFNQSKLLKLAKQAKKLGVELFVLDDGWFGHRDDDTSSLGDYTINKKKLPFGLKYLADQIHKMGLQFGLWFEPEMVNPQSELYQKHPEYAISIPGRNPSLGRNQLVLDLCQKEVRDYIKTSLMSVLDTVTIDYIKWDMNRHITDMYSKALTHQGAFYHQYILGLYDILFDIQKKYPSILIETCSSGGNRFDLGMLSFGAQVWASDDTDPIERLKIQEGLSYLYPLSTISAHVSLAPHAQTLRETPLSTRFNVASFGVLGYELNFDYLSPAEKQEIKHQIAFYKTHRDLFQFGEFKRHEKKDNFHMTWQIQHKESTIIAQYQTLAEASPAFEKLYVKDVENEKMYRIQNFKQRLPLKRFGHLISHALPIKLNTNGFIMRQIGKYKTLDNATIDTIASGLILQQGLKLKQQFMGTYYNDQTRMIGDFGSMIYVIEPFSGGISDEKNNSI